MEPVCGLRAFEAAVVETDAGDGAEISRKGNKGELRHAGVVDTGILSLGWPVVDRLADVFFRPFISTPRQGAKAALHALDSDETGRLYAQSGVIG